MSGPVTIRIPADTAHVALVRAAATALAARMDFSFDRITDLHIAIDEMCSRLLAVSDGPTCIVVRFEGRDATLVIEGSVDGTRREERELFTEWSRVILEAIADRISSKENDGSIALQLELSKGSA